MLVAVMKMRHYTHLQQIREEPARGLAARWGGVPGDYLALIDFFDKPCEFALANPGAAALIAHNSFGIFLTYCRSA